MMSAAEVAGHLLRAVHRRKRDLVLTGEGRAVIWLDKWFPAWADKVVFRHMAAEPGAPMTKQPKLER
jgi:hypothetical protein